MTKTNANEESKGKALWKKVATRYSKIVKKFKEQNDKLINRDLQTFLKMEQFEHKKHLYEKMKKKRERSDDDEYAKIKNELEQQEFDICDLESLQDAQVDNVLLENHFLHQKKQNN